MDPTTLVTFLFKAPPEVRTVELLGSWDNFSRPYYMHHDKRRGHGLWSGCFNFKDIIFDGDKTEWTKPRTGGLKQGGTYWYFYRLNDAIEAFDDFQTYTQGCPLLPGQTVNVMDVPIEVEEPPSRRRSAGFDAVGTPSDLHRTQTLDADDKWQALEPPPISKVHERCISDLALNGRLETKPHSLREQHAGTPISPVPADDVQPALVVPRQRSAGDASSMRWKNGWSSASSSRAESSIFDAYSITNDGADSASLSAFPLPNSHQVNGRPVKTGDGRRAYHGFDFAFNSASTRNISSRTGDEDLDGSSFVFEDAESPPQSACGSVDWRLTVTPAHNSARVASDKFVRQQSRASDTESVRRRSEDSTADESADTTAFDICSPTFSAATVSSNGGELNTPFRLSANYARNTAPPSVGAPTTDGNDEMSASIEHVTERLRQLGSEDSAGSLPSQVSDKAEKRPFVGHYALPVHDLAVASATTLGKASSGQASVGPQGLPPLPKTTTQLGLEDSFADSIFSELGYLSASIA